MKSAHTPTRKIEGVILMRCESAGFKERYFGLSSAF